MISKSPIFVRVKVINPWSCVDYFLILSLPLPWFHFSFAVLKLFGHLLIQEQSLPSVSCRKDFFQYTKTHKEIESRKLLAYLLSCVVMESSLPSLSIIYLYILGYTHFSMTSSVVAIVAQMNALCHTAKLTCTYNL